MGRALSLCLVLGACSSSSPAPQTWTVVGEDQPSALLSVWASSGSDVWVVGGDPHDGNGPIVEHYDGTAWTKLDSGQRNVDLWWVKGFAGGPVFMSGSNGTILRYQNGSFEKLATPGNFVVFGLWGATADDLWAVGGNFGGGGFAWRFDGTTWTVFPGVPADIMSQGTCWKVNGRASDDIWISGSNGATLHWNGAGLDRTDIPAAIDAPLLSVSGNSARFITVGGTGTGVLFENDGSGWTSALPAGGNPLAGVTSSEDTAYAVGAYGTILHRGDHGWSTELPAVTDQNLHTAFIDPSGGVWAVGGHYDAPMSAGVLLHKGDPVGDL